MMDDASTVEGGGPQDTAPAARVGHGPPLPDPQLSRAAQSSWPQVIGIISIVLGALGILYHSCNGVFAPLMPAFFDSMAGTGAGGGGGGSAPPTIEAQAESMRRFAIPTMVNSVAGVGLSILLTCSGVALIRRRRWSRRGALWWSGLKAIHALGASLLGYLVMEDQWQVIANDPAVTGAGGGGGAGAGMIVFMRGFSAASILLGLAFLLAYPVFLTIWFNRRKVIEEVAGWE